MRVEKLDDRTLGWMFCLDGHKLLYKFATLELPWRNNEKNVSCIPVGRYKITTEDDPKRGFVLRVHDVPNRDGVLLHRGSLPEHTQGCICYGTDFAPDSNSPLGCSAAQDKMERLISGYASLIIFDAT